MPWRGPQFPGELPTLGWYVLDWFAEYLIVPDGPAAGQPLELTPEQAQFVLNFYAVDSRFEGPAVRGKALNNARRVRRAVLCRPKGHGKSPLLAGLCLVETLGDVVLDGWDANGEPVGRPWSSLGFKAKAQVVAVSEDQPLALETPVPTPTGWSTVGDLRTGDHVLGGDGQPVEVKRVTPVYRDLDCYRVTFDDGEEIVASANHGWTLQRLNGHGDEHELITTTTAQLAADYLNFWGRRRYRMRLAAYDLPSAELPIDPYLLGLWLGDGDSRDSSIAVGSRDAAETAVILKALLQPHEEAIWASCRGAWKTVRIRRRKGMCPYGHEGHRVGHGKGLTTCGTCRATRGQPRTRYPSLRERLRDLGVLGDKHIPLSYLRGSLDQRLALLQGLVDSDGHVTAKGRVSFTNTNRRLAGNTGELLTSLGYKWFSRDDGNAVRVFFVPGDGRPVARLSRKRDAQTVWSARSTSRWRYVSKVEQVESTPVRCVGLDTPDHLFLVGHRGVLTHNTGNTWDPLLEMAREGPVGDAYDIEPMETFVNVPRGRIEYTTSAAVSREGFRPVFCAMDQTESWVKSNGGHALAATIRRNLAKVGGSSVETPNAWVPGLDSVAEKSHQAWVQQQEGRLKGGDGILFDHREAPVATNPADRDSLMAGLAVSYGDSADVNGGHVTLARILEDYWDPATDPSDARRFYLNQIAPAEDAWLAPQEWAAIADPTVTVPDGAEIVLFFDGSKSSDATALIGCVVESGHVFDAGVWEPDPNDPDDVVPVAAVDAAVARAFDRWNPVAFFADVREWESYVHTMWPDLYGDRLLVMANPRGRNAGPIAWDMRARTQDFTLAAEACHSEITERQFTHDGSSSVARHVANARRRPNRYGISVGKESPRSPLKIDAAVCVIGVRMVRRIVLASPEWAKRSKKRARTGRVYGFS